MEVDLLASSAALLVVAAGLAGYGVRVAISGGARSTRVREVGASPLLGMRAMEFGYWCLQPVGRACVAAGLSANRITALSLLVGLGGGVALACGHLGVGALLMSLSALGDLLDGLVARSTRSAGAAGAIFDASVDRYTEFFLLGGVAFHERERAPLLALALLCILGSFMISYGSAKAEALGVAVPRGVMRRPERAVYLCGGLLLTPLAAAAVAALHLPTLLADAPLAGALALVALVSNISAALRLHSVARAGSRAPLIAALPGARATSAVVENLPAPALSSARATSASVESLPAPALRITRAAAQR